MKLDNNQTDSYIIREAMRLLGKRTSKKKAASSKRNGKLGGRPRGINTKHKRKIVFKVFIPLASVRKDVLE